MIRLLIFNALMIVLGAGIATQFVPTRLLAEPLRVLHITIGITTAPPEKVRDWSRGRTAVPARLPHFAVRVTHPTAAP